MNLVVLDLKLVLGLKRQSRLSYSNISGIERAQAALLVCLEAIHTFHLLFTLESLLCTCAKSVHVILNATVLFDIGNSCSN